MRGYVKALFGLEMDDVSLWLVVFRVLDGWGRGLGDTSDIGFGFRLSGLGTLLLGIVYCSTFSVLFVDTLVPVITFTFGSNLPVCPHF